MTVDYRSAFFTTSRVREWFHVDMHQLRFESIKTEIGASLISFQHHLLVSLDVRPYSISPRENKMVAMVFNSIASTYDEIWLEKFGRRRVTLQQQLKIPMFVHLWMYSTDDRSIWISALCPLGEVYFPTPWKEPICTPPGSQYLVSQFFSVEWVNHYRQLSLCCRLSSSWSLFE